MLENSDSREGYQGKKKAPLPPQTPAIILSLKVNHSYLV